MAIGAFASIALLTLSAILQGSDSGAVSCFGIGLLTSVLLFVVGIGRRGRQRHIAVLIFLLYVSVLVLLLPNYSLFRDHVRWVLVSGSYKAKVLAQPSSEPLKHAEWDYSGFAGIGNMTTFLVFDPTDSLAGATKEPPPVKADGLPCEVARVRRLGRQWYVVLFYADTYWGQGACK